MDWRTPPPRTLRRPRGRRRWPSSPAGRSEWACVSRDMSFRPPRRVWVDGNSYLVGSHPPSLAIETHQRDDHVESSHHRSPTQPPFAVVSHPRHTRRLTGQSPNTRPAEPANPCNFSSVTVDCLHIAWGVCRQQETQRVGISPSPLPFVDRGPVLLLGDAVILDSYGTSM